MRIQGVIYSASNVTHKLNICSCSLALVGLRLYKLQLRVHTVLTPPPDPSLYNHSLYQNNSGISLEGFSSQNVNLRVCIFTSQPKLPFRRTTEPHHPQFRYTQTRSQGGRAIRGKEESVYPTSHRNGNGSGNRIESSHFTSPALSSSTFQLGAITMTQTNNLIQQRIQTTIWKRIWAMV